MPNGSQRILQSPMPNSLTLGTGQFVEFILTHERNESVKTQTVWVFIAQMVEYCSANAEAMCLNPKVPKFFSGLLAIA